MHQTDPYALYLCEPKYGEMVNAIKETLELIEQQNLVDAYHKFNYDLLQIL